MPSRQSHHRCCAIRPDLAAKVRRLRFGPRMRRRILPPRGAGRPGEDETPRASIPIHCRFQGTEQLRYQLHFIDNERAVGHVTFDEASWIASRGPALRIVVQCHHDAATLARDLSCQCTFAHLPWTVDGDDRRVGQRFVHQTNSSPREGQRSGHAGTLFHPSTICHANSSTDGCGSVDVLAADPSTFGYGPTGSVR